MGNSEWSYEISTATTDLVDRYSTERLKIGIFESELDDEDVNEEDTNNISGDLLCNCILDDLYHTKKPLTVQMLIWF